MPELIYQPWDRESVDNSITQAKDFFQSLHITDIQVLKNPSRAEVVDKFKQLLQYAIQYSREGLVVLIRWIGLSVKGKYKIKVKSDVN